MENFGIKNLGLWNSQFGSRIRDKYLESIAWNPESKGVLVLHYILAKFLGVIIVRTLRRRIG